MERQNKIKTLTVSCVCIVVSFALYYYGGSLIGKIIHNSYVDSFVSELMFAFFAVLSLVFLKKTDVLRFRLKGFGEGLKAAAFLIVLDLIVLLAFLLKHDPVTATPFETSCFVLNMLLIGVAEEVLFRGILQNALMDFIGYDSVGKIRLGIVLTGVVFGAFHLMNGFSPEIGFVHAGVQALNVSFTGMLFAVAYYRSGKNIWPVILIHAFGDGCSFLFGGGLSGVGYGETIASGSVTGGLFAPIITLLVVMWVVRKKKIVLPPT